MSEPWTLGSVVFGPDRKPVPIITSQGGKPYNYEALKALQDEIARLLAALQAAEGECPSCLAWQEAADAAEARVAALEAAVRWALGVGEEEFRPREHGDGPYWWRRELSRRAALQSPPPAAGR